MMRHLPSRRPATILLAAALSLVAFAGVASAHAELETATPADGATVEGTPPEISGIYSEPMDPDGSSLKLVDASGAELATGGVVPGDDTKMAIDPVPTLVPGGYTVESTTKSAADGDIDRKTWTFTVAAAPSAAPSATPTATATAAPSTAASASPSAAAPSATASANATPVASAGTNTGSSSGSGTDVLLPILAAVVILVAIGGYLYSRRDRSTPTPS